MLLFPDMEIEQPAAQEFCFASPCTLTEFRNLKAKSVKLEGYLPYTYVSVEENYEEEQVAIILLSFADADNGFDFATTTAAYLRMVEDFNGMIYVMRHAHRDAQNSIASIIARTAGVPPHQVRHVEI